MILVRIIRIALWAITPFAMLAPASIATAGTMPADPVCVQGDCTFTPATATTSTVSVPAIATTTTTTTTTTTGNKTFSRRQTIKMIRAYERRTRTIIAVAMVPGGLKSAKGCVDPVRKGWIKVGGQFQNTRANGSPFWDRWERGWRLCGSKRVKVGNLYYMQGAKLNCGNRNVRIPLGKAKRVKRTLRKSVEVASWKAAISIVKVEVNTTTTTITPSSSTQYHCVEGTLRGNQCETTKVTYNCPQGSELIVKDGNQVCKTCPPPTCTCPPGSSVGNDQKCHKDGTTTPPTTSSGTVVPGVSTNPAPGPNPPPDPQDPTNTPENPTGSWQCYSESTGQPVQPSADGRCPVGSYGG